MSSNSNKAKRATARPRKQPTIPINSNLELHQQKLLARLNLKQQNSLTSSDDENLNHHDNNNIHIIKRNSIGNNNRLEKNDSLENEPEEELSENNNYVDDIDEEIRSTTEYTTNDEMDLESGSVNVNVNAFNSVNNVRNKFFNNMMIVNNDNGGDLNQLNEIDTYLEQNLRKDEILAAKMTKFLSVSFDLFSSFFSDQIKPFLIRYFKKHIRLSLLGSRLFNT